MNGSQDINFNATECLRTATDIGVERVHNICTGTVTAVEWGSADWALAIVFGSLMAAAALVVSAIVILIIRDGLRGY